MIPSPIHPNPPADEPAGWKPDDAAHARVVIDLIVSDMAAGSAHARRQGARLAACVAALDAEAAQLSAGVCEHQRWNGHGNAFCSRTGELI